MNTEQRPDGWWIVGPDDDVGPYDTKAEAEATRVRLERFERADRRGDREFILGTSPHSPPLCR